MPGDSSQSPSVLLDETSNPTFRSVFGELLSRSSTADTAIVRIRLGAVDLSSDELRPIRRFRVMVADVNARTVESEAYAMAVDRTKRSNLHRILGLIQDGLLEIRASPLGGWSPDFTIFSGQEGPHSLLLGLHWFHHPFPHRGPAWTSWFGPPEASRASVRFDRLWEQAHDIGPAIARLMEATTARGHQVPVDTPKCPG